MLIFLTKALSPYVSKPPKFITNGLYDSRCMVILPATELPIDGTKLCCWSWAQGCDQLDVLQPLHFYASYLLFYFFFYLLPSRILDPLRFQAGRRRRGPNLGLVCFDLMFAVFLVKDARVRYVVVDLVLVL